MSSTDRCHDLLVWVFAALAVAAALPGISAAPIDNNRVRYRPPRIGVQAQVQEASVYTQRHESSSFPLDTGSNRVTHAPLHRVDLPSQVDAFVVRLPPRRSPRSS